MLIYLIVSAILLKVVAVADESRDLNKICGAYTYKIMLKSFQHSHLKDKNVHHFREKMKEKLVEHNVELRTTTDISQKYLICLSKLIQLEETCANPPKFDEKPKPGGGGGGGNIDCAQCESALAAKEKENERLQHKVRDLEAELMKLYKQLVDKDIELQSHHSKLAERDAAIARLNMKLAEKDAEIERHHKQMAEKDAEIERHHQQLVEKNEQIKRLEAELTKKDEQIQELEDGKNNRPTNCMDIEMATGVHTIEVEGLAPFAVSCDSEKAGPGWTVIQRRIHGNGIDFYRSWADYRAGFGDASTEYWIGLERLHRLTKEERFELHFTLQDRANVTRTARYDNFVVGGAHDNYKLISVGEYSGNAGDAMQLHVGYQFSTYDRDNNPLDYGNCAVFLQGAWWYSFCAHCNPNGKNFDCDMENTNALETSGCIYWNPWHGRSYSLRFVQMMIRPYNTN